MENDLIKRIRMCCVCKTIILNGVLVPPKKYSEEELVSRGFYFSDGILSKECFKDHHPEIDLTDYKFDYESCKIQ